MAERLTFPKGTVAGQPVTDGNSERSWWQQLFAGVAPTRKQTGIEDPEIERRVARFMLKCETLGEFYARTGVGRSQILTLNQDELARLIATATEGNTFVAPKPAAFNFSEPNAPRVVDTWGS